MRAVRLACIVAVLSILAAIGVVVIRSQSSSYPETPRTASELLDRMERELRKSEDVLWIRVLRDNPVHQTDVQAIIDFERDRAILERTTRRVDETAVPFPELTKLVGLPPEGTDYVVWVGEQVIPFDVKGHPSGTRVRSSYPSGCVEAGSDLSTLIACGLAPNAGLALRRPTLLPDVYQSTYFGHATIALAYEWRQAGIEVSVRGDQTTGGQFARTSRAEFRVDSSTWLPLGLSVVETNDDTGTVNLKYDIRYESELIDRRRAEEIMDGPASDLFFRK